MSDSDSSLSEDDSNAARLISGSSTSRRASDFIFVQGQVQGQRALTSPRPVASNGPAKTGTSWSLGTNSASSTPRRSKLIVITPTVSTTSLRSSSSDDSLSDDALNVGESDRHIRSFHLKEKRPQRAIHRKSPAELELTNPTVVERQLQYLPEAEDLVLETPEEAGPTREPPSFPEPNEHIDGGDRQPSLGGDDVVVEVPEEFTPGQHITITAEGAGTLQRSPDSSPSPEGSSHHSDSGDGPTSLGGDDVIVEVPEEYTPGQHITITAEGAGTLQRSPDSAPSPEGSSHHSDSGEGESDNDNLGLDNENRGSFALRGIEPEDEVQERGPPLHPRIKHRAKAALSRGIQLLDDRERLEKESKWSKYCTLGTYCSRFQPPETPPNIRFASAVGFRMMPNFLFPAVPKLLEDLWVFMELAITIFEIIFAALTFENEPLNIFILLLTIINVVLAVVDSFLYFIQGGSCATSYRYVKKKIAKRRRKSAQDEDEDEEEEEVRNRCQFITDGQKKFLGTWFQVIRTVLSELLLYPLAVGDLIELIESRTYDLESAEDDINFGLFNIGGFFLILSVYFMRTFMAISSIVSVQRLPKTTPNNYVNIVTRFCVHLILQNISHAAILGMVGAKINSEVAACGNGNETEEQELSASPFLWYVVVAGDIIPLFGVIMFFVVNYSLLKQFSVGFYLDLMSSVVSEGFAELVFEGEGIKTAKHKAEKVVKKSNLLATREDFDRYIKRFSWKKRILYRFTHPPVVLVSFLHVTILTIFLVCHALTEDPCSGEMKSLLGDDAGVTASFVVGLVVFLVANYQSIFLTATVMIIPVSIILFPVLAVILTPVFFALGVYYAIASPQPSRTASQSRAVSIVIENNQADTALDLTNS